MDRTLTLPRNETTRTMQFASIRIITDDLDRLVSFYEHLTGITADRPAPPLVQ